MFDYKLLIILIVGIALIFLFYYNKKIKSSDKYLYFLLPIALIILLIYKNYQHLVVCESTKKILKWTIILMFVLGIYMYFRTKSNYYPHYVYRTSIRIIWCIIIFSLIIYWQDPNKLYNIGVLKIVLFVGLIITIIKI